MQGTKPHYAVKSADMTASTARANTRQTEDFHAIEALNFWTTGLEAATILGNLPLIQGDLERIL
jgi:hypothetical protein